ncbi:MAG: hypothetical protein IJ637_08020 [Prevotella sp.]|nr:hypothetical protein [Prevotella sp.]
MKKKIAFVDFWGTFVPEKFKVTEYLRAKWDIEIVDMAHADYVFFSDHGNEHWFAPDHAVKIYYTMENSVPDFNACDYAIGFDWMQYEDRYLRFPLYYFYPNICELMEHKHEIDVREVKTKKTSFCSMTVSNTNRDPMFMALFEELSKYKHIDSGGLWRNNMGGRVPDKLAFDKAHKFSIVCENSAHSGYTTEKLVQAFAANCIPIYWGDPSLSKVFNPKALINVRDFQTLQDAIECVKKVDEDDTLYESYLREPALGNLSYAKDSQIALLQDFLYHIFDQPIETAYRRNRTLRGKLYIEERQMQVKSFSYVAKMRFKKFVWKAKQYIRKRRVSKDDHMVFPSIPT